MTITHNILNDFVISNSMKPRSRLTISIIFSQVWLPFSDSFATGKLKVNTHLLQLSYCPIYQSENIAKNNFHYLVLHIT